MRVQIKPALRQVWRSRETVQIGLDPRFATVLDGLTDADRALLTRLREGVETRDVVPRSLVPGAHGSPGALDSAPAPGSVPSGPDAPSDSPESSEPALASAGTASPSAASAAAETGARVPSRRDRDAELLGLLADAGVLVRTRAGRATLSRIGASRDRLTPDAQAWSVVHGRDGDDGWELLGARAHRWVDVVGGGRLGRTLATTLACAGVGQVTLQDPTVVTGADVGPAAATPAEIGHLREDTYRDQVERLLGPAPRSASRRAEDTPRWQDHLADGDLPQVPRLDGPADGRREGRRRRRGTAPEPDPRLPDVVVLVEHAVADAATGQRLLSADVAHLSVVVREGTVVVGPFVVPGNAPCLRCLDLHRSERDPGWPRILAQLLGSRLAAPAPCPEETASAQLAASLAALQVLGHLDELHLARGTRPTSRGATLEVELPDGLVSRREWPAHPACGCAVLD